MPEPPARRSWFGVLNPTSGFGRGARDRPRIEAALREAGVDFTLAVTERAGHAPALVGTALDAGRRDILAIGGDGTMHEAVNAILDHPAGATATLAAIPVGTGNDWCRGLGVPRDYRAAAANIAGGHVVHVDAGRVDLQEGGPPRWFANVAGAGFDAHVIENMPPRRFGRLAYLAGVLRGLAGYRPQQMRVTADGVVHEGRMFVAFCCLGRYCGAGMHIAPAADPGDGRFDVVLIGDLSRLDVLASLRRLFDGTIGSHPKVRTLRAAQVMIEPVTSERPVAVEADGEPIGGTPVALSVLPAALRVLVPLGS
jgi:YegS/Rv2252/BmrU family lipid kinase